MKGKKISIIVPVYNSEKFLDLLVEAVDIEKNKNNWDLELILIDDGSKDHSFKKIFELAKIFKYIKGIKLSRNFGHQIAVKTGLTYCSGDYIAIIDDDLQDPPNLLPSFFTYLDNGYDVAYGVRKKRKESFIKKLSYASFYKILKKISNTDIQLDSGDFCVMKKRVVENMLKLQEKNPFLRGIRAWIGFNQIGVEYERQARVAGESGYTLKKLFKIAKDGIFSFSNVPIRLITILGSLGLVFAFFFSCYILFQYFVNLIPVKGYTSLIIIISFFSSLILVCLGIIGEYIVRIYDEVRNRPFTVIDETINV
ncbi:glycosyltransferase family 2 protein [Flavobacterium sp. NRK F10]|uniref:Glycosyltransferase n=1 Tax=Flavobacterium sediminis TaxID=2201181 RepID=A0A2U8QV46_9FLAO|nr:MULTISPECIES: glycosyltransferase family 2 protein [Flavobacterium]AWM13665.1 glycosyltransferase [Flavobacterium sediminis]MCO6174788.1 glycosyltransferase family 2 protein [Flavobacterium sp. NRK F10]